MGPQARREQTITWITLVLVWLAGASMAAFKVLQAVPILWGRYVEGFRATAGSLPQIGSAEVDGEPIPLSAISLETRLLSAATCVIFAIVVVLALLAFTQVLRSIGAGRAFEAEVPRAAARACITLLVGALAFGIADALAWTRGSQEVLDLGSVSHHEATTTVGYRPAIQMIFVTLGLVAGTLALAFRQGSRIQKELDGVI
jgi:hypothetical protein